MPPLEFRTGLPVHGIHQSVLKVRLAQSEELFIGGSSGIQGCGRSFLHLLQGINKSFPIYLNPSQ